MAKNPKTKRTQIQDLPVAEQELTTEEMEKVGGGKTWNETRSNNNVAAAPPPVPTKTQTPLPPAPGKTNTTSQGTSFGS